MVEVCTMDYDAYRQRPTDFPTLQDLESVYCPSRRQREVVKLSELVEVSKHLHARSRPQSIKRVHEVLFLASTQQRKHEGDRNSTTVEPTGLIFHESPSSVIFTSLLVSAPPNLVLSEPSFLISAIEQCR